MRFYFTVYLVNSLEQEKAQGKAGRIALGLLRMDIVILYELGYLPFAEIRISPWLLPFSGCHWEIDETACRLPAFRDCQQVAGSVSPGLCQ